MKRIIALLIAGITLITPAVAKWPTHSGGSHSHSHSSTHYHW